MPSLRKLDSMRTPSTTTDRSTRRIAALREPRLDRSSHHRPRAIALPFTNFPKLNSLALNNTSYGRRYASALATFAAKLDYLDLRTAPTRTLCCPAASNFPVLKVLDVCATRSAVRPCGRFSRPCISARSKCSGQTAATSERLHQGAAGGPLAARRPRLRNNH